MKVTDELNDKHKDFLKTHLNFVDDIHTLSNEDFRTLCDRVMKIYHSEAKKEDPLNNRPISRLGIMACDIYSYMCNQYSEGGRR